MSIREFYHIQGIIWMSIREFDHIQGIIWMSIREFYHITAQFVGAQRVFSMFGASFWEHLGNFSTSQGNIKGKLPYLGHPFEEHQGNWRIFKYHLEEYQSILTNLGHLLEGDWSHFSTLGHLLEIKKVKYIWSTIYRSAKDISPHWGISWTSTTEYFYTIWRSIKVN